MKSVWVSGLFLVICAAQEARANEPLRKARVAYEALEYERVMPLARNALKIAGDVTEETEIYALMAFVHVIYDRNKLARQAFLEVLARDVGFALPAETSPKILAAFEKAKEAHGRAGPRPGDEDGPDLSTLPPPAAQGLSRAAEPRLYDRWWFWTAVGVVVVGAGALTWGLLRDPGPPEHDLGPVPLQ